MAILNLEWLSIFNPKSTQFHPRATTLVSISIPRSLPVNSPAAGRGVSVVCSAGSSSFLLEETSDGIKLIQFGSSSAPLKSSSSISDLGRSDVLVNGSKKEVVEVTGGLTSQYNGTPRLRIGFQPDPQALKVLIKKLQSSKDWNSISALSDEMRSTGVFPDRATCARLVGGCIRARRFKIADSLLGVFETSKGDIAVAAFGAAVRAYNKLHMYSTTVLVHERMMAAAIRPDPACYCWAMEAYDKVGNTTKVVSLFEEFESTKSADVFSTEISTKINLILCDSLGRAGKAFEALRYMREITVKEVTLNPSIYASLICSFAGIKEAEIANDLFEEARNRGQLKDPAVFLKLVLMYVDLGSPAKSIDVVRSMREMDIGVSDCVFCAVINGHVKKEGLRASLRAYEDLISLGCVPGQVTYASIINVYCRLGLTSLAEKTFNEMVGKGFDRCIVAYSNMVSMYGKTSRVRDAMRLLAKMKQKGCHPNVWVYNSLIDMHGRATNLRQVEKLWKEMKRKKVSPDKVSYTSMIGAYNKAREFDQCLELYNEFRINGGKIDRAMGGIMIGVFSKTSRVDELIKLLKDLELEGVVLDERMFMSSLNALRDAGLQQHVKWFRQSFGYVKVNRRSGDPHDV